MSAVEQSKIRVTINSRDTALHVDLRQSLAAALRDQLQLSSMHIGCAQGHCGTCNVLIDGVLVRGCLIFACQADGSEVLTMEGILDDARFDVIKEVLTRNGALQCGYCTPGFVVLLAAIVQGNLDAVEAREALSSNLCRCTGYSGLIAAVDDVVGTQTACSFPGTTRQA